jgi:hypothetical protein
MQFFPGLLEQPMSAQEPDLVIYRKRRYELVGASGGLLFDPAEHGIELVADRTSCHRGFICTYAVKAQQLLLRDVGVCMDTTIGTNALIRLFGKSPVVSDRSFPPVIYRQLNVEIPYSGGLLLGLGLIPEFYLHMGFQPVWTYRKVHELVFQSGHLMEARDCSMAAEEFRRGRQPGDLQFGIEGVVAWIEKTFRLDYNRDC